MISLVVAVAENGVIGVDNQLPWHISSDLKRFKQITLGHPIVMGRKTYDSIGKPLPGRTNIVLSRSADQLPETVVWAADIDTALEKAKSAPGGEEVFIIGGGRVYEQVLAFADRVYLSLVQLRPNGDRTFPLEKLTSFPKKSAIEDVPASGDQPGYRFMILDRH